MPWFLLVVLSTLSVAAQPQFRAEGRLVLVNAGVYGENRQFRRDLAARDFHLFDEGREVAVDSWALEEVPVSVVLVLDTSRSMSTRFPAAVAAIEQLLARRREGDEFCLLPFGPSPGRCEFTADVDVVRGQLRQLRPDGATALWDAVAAGFGASRTAHNTRRAVIVLSDGIDNASRYDLRELERQAEETNAILYAVNEMPWAHGGREWQVQRLQKLAELTGGGMWPISQERPWAGSLADLDLRWQYVLSFTNSRPPDGRRHRLQLKVQTLDRQRMTLHWRRSYRHQ